MLLMNNDAEVQNYLWILNLYYRSKFDTFRGFLIVWLARKLSTRELTKMLSLQIVAKFN